MRKLKFRQRNLNNGQFHYWGLVNGKWVQPLIQDNYISPENSDQYIGFRDKDQKEIYERDRIVAITNIGRNQFVIEDIANMWFLDYCIGKVKIIGNIYDQRR